MKDHSPKTLKHEVDPELWVKKHGDALFLYALLNLRDPAVAEEVVQETFLAALRAKERFQGRSSERTWLTGILRHKIFDHFRRIKRERPASDLALSDDSIEDLFDKRGQWKNGPSDWPTDPAKALQQKEFVKILLHCLSELSQNLADAFILREIEGCKGKEICNLLDISATNLGVRIFRARNRLRRCLEENWLG
jgi:RNA polymerase sigma-70 factor (ECF subfamily)